jgi:hypothetical protein
MARLPCTKPGATPEVGPVNSPRRIAMRASLPVEGRVELGRRCMLSTDTGQIPYAGRTHGPGRWPILSSDEAGQNRRFMQHSLFQLRQKNGRQIGERAL